MEIRVHVVPGDFFLPVGRVVTTSVPIEDAVSLAGLFEQAGRRVFGEESYKDLLEDMAMALADEYDVESEEDWEKVWPKGYLLPRVKPMKSELAKEIYKKRRAQVLEYARLIKEKLQSGYVVAKAVKVEEPQEYRYPEPNHLWTYELEGGATLLVKLRS